jgi:hypothetical protein
MLGQLVKICLAWRVCVHKGVHLVGYAVRDREGNGSGRPSGGGFSFFGLGYVLLAQAWETLILCYRVLECFFEYQYTHLHAT